MHLTSLKAAWYEAKRRCLDSQNPSYPFYGGKGIKFCEEWLNFSVFSDWAVKNGYEKGKVLLRRNKDKDYAPRNCFWGNPDQISTQNTYKKKLKKINSKKNRMKNKKKIAEIQKRYYKNNPVKIKKNIAKYQKTKKYREYMSNYRNTNIRANLYSRWNSMLHRKGAPICPEWEDFDTFFRWAIRHGFTLNTRLNRIDKAGELCPENCFWSEPLNANKKEKK